MPPRPPLLLFRRTFTTTPRRRAEESVKEAELDDTEFSVEVSKAWEDRKEVKDMLQWLQLEGEQYRRPAPGGGTNYLKSRREKAEQFKEGSESPDVRKRDRSRTGEVIQVTDVASYIQKLKQTNSFERPKFPLKPFAQNEKYTSQSILSEAHKEAIYRYVVTEKKDVKRASERFKVSIERVVAVVRMKQIERDLAQNVSIISSLSPPLYNDESNMRIR
jgi:hypothetical protein